ncbi:VOC family protein [Halosimplex salinum]|uniref:VOC family protein n=1 Tax=Halosimplex salinum TaxID=1710538 RepID=UPI000F4A7E0D|nr:VOC family protein [Halosimplex salinum]
MPSIDGIHHVTAFADEPQENYDFFTNVLGLRFVKRTVRFDVPEKIYHLYYGDERGTPGTIITYFPMTNMEMGDGMVGKGQMSSVGLVIPEGSVDYWTGRFEAHGVDYDVEERFDETAVAFTDPDGTPYELVTGESDIEPWEGSDVPAEHGIRGMHSTTIHSADPQGTFDVLETMGWERLGRADHPQAGDRVRYEAPGDTTRADVVDVLIRPNAPDGVMGVGTFLHVAFRVNNNWEQDEWSDTLRENGYITTSRKDRDYFQSRYITEPGGAVFEYATTDVGFDVDEDIDELGENLKKPDWLDVDLEEIERMLPDLETN